jgi:2-polyprenyl-6-methoxyphenol hydroxylase-like FAD-dependent oxidoreductase
VANEIEVIFGNSIRGLAQDDAGVEVSFAHGTSRRFDLVVGADGLHSVVRSLAFGEESRFLKYFGYYTASFTVESEIGRVQSFASHTAPGRQVGIYPIDARHLATFFLFTTPEPLAYDRHDVAHQMRILREAFDGVGWECPRLLELMESAPDFYFDSVSQIEMDRWSHGRITLVGDACGCPSLLSGKGATLAMAGAFVLAGELQRAAGDAAGAFPRYEALLKPYVAEKQKLAGQFAGSFLPRSALGVWARNKFAGVMNLRPLSKWFIGKFMTDTLRLQEYGATATAPRAAQVG